MSAAPTFQVVPIPSAFFQNEKIVSLFRRLLIVIADRERVPVDERIPGKAYTFDPPITIPGFLSSKPFTDMSFHFIKDNILMRFVSKEIAPVSETSASIVLKYDEISSYHWYCREERGGRDRCREAAISLLERLGLYPPFYYTLSPDAAATSSIPIPISSSLSRDELFSRLPAYSIKNPLSHLPGSIASSAVASPAAVRVPVSSAPASSASASRAPIMTSSSTIKPFRKRNAKLNAPEEIELSTIPKAEGGRRKTKRRPKKYRKSRKTHGKRRI